MRPIPSIFYPFIRSVEGVKLYEYTDIAGVKTIYCGHVCKAGELYTHTIEDVDKYLQADATYAAGVVGRLTDKLFLDANEYAALISFAFNAGTTAFANSTLLKLLQQGDKIGAANQFLVWNKIRNPQTKQLEFSAGLNNRRVAERKLFLGQN
jgi:lysozyme